MSALATVDFEKQSVFEAMKACLANDQDRLNVFLSELTADEVNLLLFDPELFLRPKQKLPAFGEWTLWSVEAGRGFGKTELGSGNINRLAFENPGIRIGLMGWNLGEVFTSMIYGPSGIIPRSHPSFVPKYNEKKRILTWPNGSEAHIFTADEPEGLRSFQCHVFWWDEPYKCRYQQDIAKGLVYVMRLKWQPGFTTWRRPIQIWTSTPRKTKLCRETRANAATGKVILTLGNSFENEANLAPEYLEELNAIKHTSLGRQEVGAELLDDEGTLFKYELIDRHRHVFDDSKEAKTLEQQTFELLSTMDKVVVAVDPSISDGENADETGIIVAGRRGTDGFVFDDLSRQGSPKQWADAVAKAYEKYDCDVCVYERNQGGLLVEETIRNTNRSIHCEGVSATKGKAVRAEPISILYEQGRIHHVGELVELEAQMIGFNPALGRSQKSPDRMDALVWALTKLFAKKTGRYQLFSLAR